MLWFKGKPEYYTRNIWEARKKCPMNAIKNYFADNIKISIIQTYFFLKKFMKALFIIASSCLILVSASIWYYFLIFLPWIEQQKIEILKSAENRKQENTEKLNVCIQDAESKYKHNWINQCKALKSYIETCNASIESDFEQCKANDNAAYERCKASHTIPGEFFTESNANSIKAYCWKKWCTKKTCDTYKEENWLCYLPDSTISDLDSQKTTDISRCKEQFNSENFDTSTIIKQEQVIKIIQ